MALYKLSDVLIGSAYGDHKKFCQFSSSTGKNKKKEVQV